MQDLGGRHPISQMLISEDLSRHKAFLFSYAGSKTPRTERHRIYLSNDRVYYYVEYKHNVLLTKLADLNILLVEHPKQKLDNGSGPEYV
ncbi:unnamed protein product [Didymodactylos carnosus]|uniref:Uncharacterized protein n=1 Tax=Didymodactylos carnosus TaxID=1234261 RepID=A0A815LF66_9BILA|nr:unnamed protein product [Didymodactylos carnosus]CAF1405877.1 unnamed protein product [Didymodactylos carnosus]CAF4076384.1 unnamed protein product [Didymodactylos carnosus]CAF4297262.1 unnamed protein product [Didymodactylos carnosus]